MKTKRARRWIGLAMWLWAAAVFAQESPEPVVLTVLGTNYLAVELGNGADTNDLRCLLAIASKIQRVVMGAYLARDEFNASEEELKEFLRQQIPTGEELGMKFGTSNGFEETWAEWQKGGSQYAQRVIATCELQAWKAQKSLFERYGGRVYETTMSFPLAIEAGWDYLAEREAAGDFTIHDEAMRSNFWGWLERTAATLSPEEVGREAYARPPGELIKKQVLEYSPEKGRAPPAPVP
jgi:hypothetical protein